MSVRGAALVSIIALLAWLAGAAGLRAAGLDDVAHWLNGAASVGVIVAVIPWIRWARSQPRLNQALVGSVAFVALWQAGICFCDFIGFVAPRQADPWFTLRANIAQLGLGGLFLIGLGWVIYGVDEVSARYEREQRELRVAAAHSHTSQPLEVVEERVWNPLNPAAWYYGRQAPKLRQSTAALLTYCVAFFMACTLVTMFSGCQEIFELPAGGGKQATVAQVVKVQKVIRKKFILNPFSSMIFKDRPIDDVKLQLMEITAHAYQVGQGEGDGAGYAGGTGRGKVSFIRLEHTGPQARWADNFGINGDGNLLREYGVRLGQKVADKPESRTIGQLANNPVGKSPPMVYITGENINLSKREVEILREYLTTKHGMLFADNGGPGFHSQFLSTMRQVLPGVEPVKVPLDDPIHLIPNPVPFLPYVSLHGGIKHALGWKVDGRWACYYHPGDIGDAWGDDHSGVPREIWEACYGLGINVMQYANSEYSKWLTSQKKK